MTASLSDHVLGWVLSIVSKEVKRQSWVSNTRGELSLIDVQEYHEVRKTNSLPLTMDLETYPFWLAKFSMSAVYLKSAQNLQCKLMINKWSNPTYVQNSLARPKYSNTA